MGCLREKRVFVCFCGEEWMGVGGSREREGSEVKGESVSFFLLLVRMHFSIP